MELLSFHNQLVADFSPDNEDDNFVTLHIIQGAQVSCPEFKLRERIRSQPFDRFRGRFWLMFEARHDGRFQDSPITA